MSSLPALASGRLPEKYKTSPDDDGPSVAPFATLTDAGSRIGAV